MRLIPLLIVFLSAFTAVADDMPSPAGAGSAQPHLASTADGRLLMSWMEPGKGEVQALRFAAFASGKWSAPRTIAERADFFVNWADFPSIVADEKGVLYVHWLQKSGSGKYAYDVHVAASRDGGETWSAPRLLHRDGKQTEHGFVSLVALPGGGAGAVWLDGRELKGEEEGEMQLRYARIAPDGKVGPEALLDARVCECCATGMAMTKKGLVAVYRDRSAEEVRDIGVVRHVDGKWTKPEAVFADNWKIDGCPVNGPQIDAHGNGVVVAWFTAAGDKQRVKVAFSSNGGVSFRQAVTVDGGAPVGRVDALMVDDSSALVTWVEGIGEAAQIVTRRIAPGGWIGPITSVGSTSAARAAGFPRTALVGDHAWFAWTEPTTPRKIRVARIALK